MLPKLRGVTSRHTVVLYFTQDQLETLYRLRPELFDGSLAINIRDSLLKETSNVEPE
jgi:hypothetical protein